jgi:hypothetical protein
MSRLRLESRVCRLRLELLLALLEKASGLVLIFVTTKRGSPFFRVIKLARITKLIRVIRVSSVTRLIRVMR